MTEVADQAQQTSGAGTTGPAAPLIRRLRIERFRGIRKLDWWPQAGVNVILGAGDSGKSTILEAIAVLLSPINGTVASDTDYWQRERENGFVIKAIMSLPPATSVNTGTQQAYPWAWDGKMAVAPTDFEDGAPPALPEIPVYKVEVAGTPDLDLDYRLVLPKGEAMAFTPTLRRAIGLVRLAGDDRNDRDLRLVQGSALDRLLSDKALRGRLGVVFSERDEGVRKALLDEGTDALDELDRSFRSQQLPHQLGLGMNVGLGQSVSALIGLTAKPDLVRLPLSSWGAGTRRLASLAVARACRTGCPVMLIDEAERGLEPYRQRALAVELAKGPSQVFMTTHSAAVLSASCAATIWHLSAQQEIGCLDPTKTAMHLTRDPETFLSRLPIIAEGPTEVGFVSELLERHFSGNLLDLGVHIANATGNSFALALMVEMARARFLFAGFVDNEGTKPEGWRSLKQQLGGLLMQWEAGCTESNVIAHLQTEQLEAFVTAQDEDVTQQRINTIVERLRLGREEELRFAKNSFLAVREAAGESLKALIEAAACGNTPEGMPESDAKTWRKHSRAWFKNELGGRELARKMFDLQVWPKLEPQLERFVRAVFDGRMPSQPDPPGA